MRLSIYAGGKILSGEESTADGSQLYHIPNLLSLGVEHY